MEELLTLKEALIQATLSNLPIYDMLVFTMPGKVVISIKRLSEDFLLGAKNNKEVATWLIGLKFNFPLIWEGLVLATLRKENIFFLLNNLWRRLYDEAYFGKIYH